MLVLTKLKLYKHSLHILNINPLSSPRTSPSLTRSNQLASPLALQKTTAVSSKRALTDFISRKKIFYHDGYLFLALQTWRVLVNHSSYFYRQAKLPLSLDGGAPRPTNPLLLSTSLDSVDSKRASSTFSSQLTKSAKTSWVTLPPPREYNITG